jgi:DNA-directed RNA polymerase subunit H (RpoH/RPB5)
MNYEIDILFRSRSTLLDHLEKSGYDTQPYRKIAHVELDQMVRAGPVGGAPPALQMELNRKEDSTDASPDASSDASPKKIKKCLVVTTLGKIKQKLKAFTEKLIDPEETGFDVNTTELIILTFEPIAANFHTMAFECYSKHGAQVRYFQCEAIINNPLNHILVPLHEKLSKEEEASVLKFYYAKKSQLPLIRFHEDPVARMLGLLPGDIVKITRSSPTAGEYIPYRVCVP